MSKPVGYECKFIDKVNDEYYCKQCQHVAREPNITTCCGETVCKACIQDKKPCPYCQEIKTNGVLQKKYQSKILALKIHCLLKERGCDWTGQLQHLNAHTDPTTGNCVYVDVDCPKGCQQKVQKHSMESHLSNKCPNREYICPHCSFKATFREVSEHFEVCRYYPLVCPNRCGATFERDELADHMKMCSLEKLKCEFSYAGCEEEFIRDKQQEHMELNTQKHLALMAAAIAGISKTIEQQKATEQNIQKQLQEKEEHIKTLEDCLQKQEKKISQLQAANFEISRGTGILPYTFTVSNYQQKAENIAHVKSPEMYTHPGGYKFKLSINICTGMSPLMGVSAYSLSSNHDDKLDFPSRFHATIQLLNQYRDQDHYTRVIQCEVKEENISKSMPLSVVNTIGSNDKFIAYTDLKWNSSSKTQYLKNDCLKFRVSDIQLL